MRKGDEMDKKELDKNLEEALQYFYGVIHGSGADNSEQFEAYKIAIDAIEAQWNIGVVQLDHDYWISKEGKMHTFDSMSTPHLKNTINMLKGSHPLEDLIDTPTFKGLCQEYVIRI